MGGLFSAFSAMRSYLGNSAYEFVSNAPRWIVQNGPGVAATTAGRGTRFATTTAGRGTRFATTAAGAGRLSLNTQTLVYTSVASRSIWFVSLLFTFTIFLLTCCAPCVRSILVSVLQWFAHVSQRLKDLFVEISKNTKGLAWLGPLLYLIRFVVDLVSAVFQGLARLLLFVLRNAFALFVLIVFMYFFIYVSVSPSTFVDISASAWDAMRGFTNAVFGTINISSSIINTILPAVNVFLAATVNFARTISSRLASVFSNAFEPGVDAPNFSSGRRLANDFFSTQDARIANIDGILTVGNQIVKPFVLIVDLIAKFFNALLDFFLTVFAPVANGLAPSLLNFIESASCAVAGGFDCFFLEFSAIIFNPIAAGIESTINDVVGIFGGRVHFGRIVGCSAEKLAARYVPCDCSIFYSGVPPCNRVVANCRLDPVTGDYVQQLDRDALASFRVSSDTFANGCSHGRRVLRAARMNDRVETARVFSDMDVHGCVDVCIANAVYAACDDGSLKFAGRTCRDASSPPPPPPPRRELQGEPASFTRESLATHFAGRNAAIFGARCEFNQPPKNPYEVIFDWTCAAKVLRDASPQSIDIDRLAHLAFDDIGSRKSHGRSLQDKPKSLLRAVSDLRHRVKVLRALIEMNANKSVVIETLEAHHRSLAETADPADTSHFSVAVEQIRVAAERAKKVIAEHRIQIDARHVVQPNTNKRRRRLAESTDMLLGECGTLYVCPAGQCVLDSALCPEPVWNQASFLTYLKYGAWYVERVTRDISLEAAMNSVADCWNGYDTDPATYPFSTANLNNPFNPRVVHCFPLIAPVELHLKRITYDLRVAVQEQCAPLGAVTVNSCTCPLYVPITYNLELLWFSFITIDVAAHYTNALITIQYIIYATLTCSACPLYFVDWTWSNFWSIFPALPPTWVNLFGDQGSGQTNAQRANSLIFFLLSLVILYMLIVVFGWPIIVCVASYLGFLPLAAIDASIARVDPVFADLNRRERERIIEDLKTYSFFKKKNELPLAQPIDKSS
jgi:hypothetical protein